MLATNSLWAHIQLLLHTIYIFSANQHNIHKHYENDIENKKKKKNF